MAIPLARSARQGCVALLPPAGHPRRGRLGTCPQAPLSRARFAVAGGGQGGEEREMKGARPPCPGSARPPPRQGPGAMSRHDAEIERLIEVNELKESNCSPWCG